MVLENVCTDNLKQQKPIQNTRISNRVKFQFDHTINYKLLIYSFFLTELEIVLIQFLIEITSNNDWSIIIENGYEVIITWGYIFWISLDTL